MKVIIPYRFTPPDGKELKYCLRGIEKYVQDPEITIIGDKPAWIKNVEHIPFKESNLLAYREKNIYDKLMLAKQDFIFFNDDHFLLQPFNFEYHYSGTLQDKITEYRFSSFRIPLKNTMELYGNIKNYYRHQPIFIKRDILYSINLDWSKEWGYCIKSIYCHLAGVEGSEYPDVKISTPTSEQKIRKLIEGRQYFSTHEAAMNANMIKVLDELYPDKSNYEI